MRQSMLDGGATADVPTGRRRSRTTHKRLHCSIGSMFIVITGVVFTQASAFDSCWIVPKLYTYDNNIFANIYSSIYY